MIKIMSSNFSTKLNLLYIIYSMSVFKLIVHNLSSNLIFNVKNIQKMGRF